MYDDAGEQRARNNTRSFLRGIVVSNSSLTPSPCASTQATTTQAQAGGQDLLRELPLRRVFRTMPSASSAAAAASSKERGGEVSNKPGPQGPAQQQYRRRSLAAQQLPFLVVLVLVALGTAQAFIPLRPSFPSSSPALRPLTQAYLFGLGGSSNSQTNKAKNGNMKTLPSRPFAPENMVQYDDDLPAKVWIFLFSGKIAAVVGAPYPRTLIPYEEYVRLSQLLLKGGSTKAKTAVLSVLRSIAFPGFSSIFRTLFPGTLRFACEFNAKVTPVFFSWLVGPAVVEASEMRNPKTYVNGEGREGGRKEGCVWWCEERGARPTSLNSCLIIHIQTQIQWRS